jgi:class 3 adenylate cyclase/tetratricopeptide (TPR) repeat protein
VRCTQCGQENRAGRKFCGDCGAHLAIVCPECRTANQPTERFCGECGVPLAAAPPAPAAAAPARRSPAPLDYTPRHLADRILRTKSALEGERKQVSVLFADVKGSMELAEELGAEAWHQILDRFFQLLTEGVHRFEGTVNQYTGDGIMALFGAPIAHEDHAQRACYAALQIRDEIAKYATELKREYGVNFSTRLGLNSGDVVVGKIGDDLRMDYTAQGQTVGLAQRMEALASPDTCYLTDATAALVGGYFDLAPLGDFRVKGVGEPVSVHRLVGVGTATSRFDISRARGLTRFVGRDADMATLDGAIAQAQAGHGQVVGIVAEAGTGKSRLCFEFIERLRARGITVNQGAGLAHGRNLPYLPMLQIFRGYYGIEERDDARTIREKIAGRMLLLDEGFREILPVLFEFFGAPDPERPTPHMDPDAKQRALFSVLRRVVQGADPRAAATDFATLIEDLHWLDPGSEAFLEQWVDAIAGSSSFLLVNFRPEYHAEWMQKSYYHQIPLAPLGPEAIQELLRDLLGPDPSTEGLAEAIHARTGGNPFFTEEVVQTLVESGHLEGVRGAYRLVTPIERLEVPPSVKAVLAARIDRRPEREKQVLQTAAVIGTEFSEPILREAAALPEVELHGALAALKNAEFVFELALYPVAGYAFKHPLTQEVALGSLLSDRRRRTHAAVARAIEDQPGARLDEAAALIAHHWEEAGEALPAARWHAAAAGWVGRSDPLEAARHMQRVLGLTQDLEDSDERDRLRLESCRSLVGRSGWRIGLSLEQAEALFAEGRRLAARMQDTDTAIALCIGYGATHGFRGDPRRYLELTKLAVDLIDERTNAGAAASAHSAGVGYASYCLGRLDDGLRHTAIGFELAENDPEAGLATTGFNIWGQSLGSMAVYTAALGSLGEGERLARQAISVCRQHDMVEALGWALGAYTGILDWEGVRLGSSAADEAMHRAIEAVEVADRSGSPFSRCGAYGALAVGHLVNERWSDAIEAAGEALAVAREESGLEREASTLALLSRAHRGQGDHEAALAWARQGVAIAELRGTRFFGAEAELTLAQALRGTRGAEAADEIETCLDRLERAIQETGGRVLAPQAIEERAWLAELRGDAEAATARLREAHRVYQEIGADPHAERVARLLAARPA